MAEIYPMTGIRSASTEPQWRLLDHAVEVLRHDERILAAWLVGSLADGREDPFSDIDLHVCVPDALVPDLREGGWRAIVDAFTPTVLTRDFFPGAIGGLCITPEWIHLDFAPLPRAYFDASRIQGMRPLFDHTGALLPSAPVPAVRAVDAPYFPTAVVEWFFYMLGNLVVVVGREEAVLGTNGIMVLRDNCLVPLFLAERGIRHDGGAKRQRPFLTPAQYDVVRSISPIVPDIDAVISSYLQIAADFVPRARRLAAQTDERWPQALEDATRLYLERALGIDIDWGTEPRPSAT